MSGVQYAFGREYIIINSSKFLSYRHNKTVADAELEKEYVTIAVLVSD